MLMSVLRLCPERAERGLLLHTGWALHIVAHTGSFGQQEEHKASRPRKGRLVSMTRFSQIWP